MKKIILLLKKIIFLIVECLRYYIKKKNSLFIEKNINKTLQNLGPTFIKFGQWLSNRKDIIPINICEKLKELQENNKPHKFKYSEKVFKKDIDYNYNKFINIEKNPIGVGSVAQVYRGTIINQIKNIPNNTKIVIKILHPNILNEVEVSIRVLKFIINIIKLIPSLKKYVSSLHIEPFFEVIKQQTKPHYEIMNLLRYSADIPKFVIVPKLYYYTENLIIESYEEGMSIDLMKKYFPKHIKECVIQLWWVFMINLLKHRYVHGDIHPGNFKYKFEGNNLKIIIFDFGIMMNLKDEKGKSFIDAFDILLIPNCDKLIEFILKTNISNNANIENTKKEILNYFDTLGLNMYYNYLKMIGLKNVFDGIDTKKNNINYDPNMVNEILKIMDKNNIILSAEYFNLFLALILIESIREVYCSEDDNTDFLIDKIKYGVNNNIYNLEKMIFY